MSFSSRGSGSCWTNCGVATARTIISSPVRTRCSPPSWKERSGAESLPILTQRRSFGTRGLAWTLPSPCVTWPPKIRRSLARNPSASHFFATTRESCCARWKTNRLRRPTCLRATTPSASHFAAMPPSPPRRGWVSSSIGGGASRRGMGSDLRQKSGLAATGACLSGPFDSRRFSAQTISGQMVSGR